MIDRKIIKRMEEGHDAATLPRLDAYSDLGRVGIIGLKEHHVTPEQFNSMTPLEQHEWAHELHVDAYKKMRYPHFKHRKHY